MKTLLMRKGLVLLISFVLFVYWAYLIFVTQPVIVHDAQTYEALGQLIHDQGMIAYLKSGPNREPLYPALVALAKILTPDDYFLGLKVLQFVLLGSSMILLYLSMRLANITRRWALPLVLYMGISPALVNSALSVYSEIITYPGILAIVLISIRAWNILQKGHRWAAVGIAMALAAAFLYVIFAKAIYETIFIVHLLPFVILGVYAWRDKNVKVYNNVLLFVVTSVCLVQGCVVTYKLLNQKYNGVYAFTDRGAWALYGNTARRQGPMTFKRISAGLAYNVLELKGCKQWFSSEECAYWDLPTSDKLAADKNYEVIARYPSQERDRQLLSETFKLIYHNPFQYVVLSTFDFLHMFFWESTHIGFVVYPDRLQKIWDVELIHDALRGLWAGLSIMGFLWGMSFLFRHFQPVYFFPAYLVLWHNLFYAMFSTLPRYALPIAGVYLFLIAGVLQNYFMKRS